MLGMSRADRVAAVEAIVLLPYARFLVNRVPLRRWRKRFGMVERPAPGRPLSQGDEAIARRVSRAIRRGLRNTPVEAVCLPQALAARWMLERRGIATTLHIGALRAGREGDRMHAWLKAGDYFVTGHCNEDDYAPLG